MQRIFESLRKRINISFTLVYLQFLILKIKKVNASSIINFRSNINVKKMLNQDVFAITIENKSY